MPNVKIQKYFSYLNAPCVECGRPLEYCIKTETPDGQGLVQLACDECRLQGTFPYDIHLPIDIYRKDVGTWFVAQLFAEVANNPSGSKSAIACLTQLRFLPPGTGLGQESYHQDRLKMILATALFELLKNGQPTSLLQIQKFMYKEWINLPL